MRILIYLILVLFVLTGCNSKNEKQHSGNKIKKADTEKKALIRKKVFFENLPSASGIEHLDSMFYVLSDDSPFLYVLNDTYTLVDTIRLFKTLHFKNGRIPTEVKYDPEALALMSFDNIPTLLALGSGAKQLRERVFLIDFQKASKNRPAVKSGLFTNFYSSLKNDPQVGGKEQVNLEGLAVDDEYVYVLPRTLKTTGTLLVYTIRDWRNFMNDSSLNLSYKYLLHVQLPEINGIKAGMSGATVFEDQLFFTASVENTQSATLDGEVLGSFIGRIDLNAVNGSSGKLIQPKTLPIVNKNGKLYLGKAESLTILEKTAHNRYRAVVVSDDDKGHSDVMEVDLHF